MERMKLVPKIAGPRFRLAQLLGRETLLTRDSTQLSEGLANAPQREPLIELDKNLLFGHDA